MSKSLSIRFKSPEDAEKCFHVTSDEVHTSTPNVSHDPTSECEELSSRSSGDENVSSSASINVVTFDTLEDQLNSIVQLEPDDLLGVLSELFSTYCSKVKLTVPDDFLTYSVRGMQQLSDAGRTNFLYSLAKGVGTMRSDGMDSMFPTKSVAAGLVEYCANFFNSVHRDAVCYYDKYMGKT